MASYLQKFYPENWSAFLNSDKLDYGYFIGYAPTYFLTNGCGNLEYPPNVNTTQYLESMGCTFKLENTTWLIFELST
jgi:hypothetical protein